MKNYSMIHAAEEAMRTELHDQLGLTGAEVTINNIPAGGGVPFFHAHKQNEEIYIILSGKGTAILDGETIELKAGDCLRIDPACSRKLSPTADSAMRYICIQAKAGSLEGFTMTDAAIC